MDSSPRTFAGKLEDLLESFRDSGGSPTAAISLLVAAAAAVTGVAKVDSGFTIRELQENLNIAFDAYEKLQALKQTPQESERNKQEQ